MLPDRLNPPKPPEGLVLLTRPFLLQYHSRIQALFGGEPGVARTAFLERTLREAQEVADGEQATPFTLGAAYGLGIARGPFKSGNLRMAAAAMAACLGVNGYTLKPNPRSLITVMRNLAEGKMDRLAMATWLRANSEALPSEDEA